MDSVIADEVNFDDEQRTEFMPKVMERVYKFTVDVSATQFGQSLLKQSEKLLWITEKTAKWSCPSESGDSSKPAPLVRPLPWLLFLPALLFIRCVRSMFSFASQLAGFESIESSDVVAYLQMTRRKLRALKYQGLRLIRIRNDQKYSNDEGISVSLICQMPNIIKQMRELLALQKKNSKCLLNESNESKNNKGKPKNKRGHSEIDDIDSSDDRQRLKAFMETSYTDETDSDDENFEVDTSEEDDSCYSDASTSDPEEAEIELHNGSESNAIPKKSQENGGAKSEDRNPTETNDEVAKANNGVIDETPKEIVAETKKTSEQKPVRSGESNSSFSAASKSPAPVNSSRDSSKENLSAQVSGGARVRPNRPSLNNRSKIYRNQKKVNGDSHRQPEDSASNAAHSTNSNKLNRSHNHGSQTTKTRPQI